LLSRGAVFWVARPGSGPRNYGRSIDSGWRITRCEDYRIGVIKFISRNVSG
jgi:hypothetical protein